MTGLPGSPAISEAELIASARRGDRQAFGEIVCHHQESMVRVIYRLTGDLALAEDAAQEAFIKAWQRLHTYKPRYPFKNWLFTIATHTALDMLRRQRPTVDLDELEESGQVSAPDETRPEAEVEMHERSGQVRRAVLALPEASRVVLVLREYEGLSYQEIAAILAIPVGTVMSRLSFARSHLRQALAPYLENS